MATSTDLDIIFSLDLAPIWSRYITQIAAIGDEGRAALKKSDTLYQSGRLSYDDWEARCTLHRSITREQQRSAAYETALRISDQLAMQLG